MLLLRVWTCALVLMFAGEASGQDFPNRAVRIYTTAPGGGSDFSARVIANTLPAALGQPVIVENRGGTVIIAATAVMKSPPDGHALLLYGSTPEEFAAAIKAEMASTGKVIKVTKAAVTSPMRCRASRAGTTFITMWSVARWAAPRC